MQQKTHIANVLERNNCKDRYDTQVKHIISDKTVLSWILKYTTSEFTGSNYDKIKKVYSIWISMENPLYAQHTITSYQLTEHPLYGLLPKHMRFDLMELVLVCLGTSQSENEGNELHGLLDTLLSPNLAPQEKETIIYHNYGIETTVELEGGLREMCNLSNLIEERGIEKGIEKGIEQGIEQGDRRRLLTLIQKKLVKGKSLEQIADELEETTEVIRPLYEQMLQEMSSVQN